MRRTWIIKYFGKKYKDVIVEGYYDTKKNAIKRNCINDERIISVHECKNYCNDDINCRCYLM